MLHRLFKQPQSLEARLSEEAKRLRAEAKLLPPGEALTANNVNEHSIILMW